MSSKLAKNQKPVSYEALLDENRALRDEIESLRARLEEAEELKRAISEGDLDALVIPGLERELVFTLDSADRAYRVLVETINEGTATLAFDGTILYCNRQFAELLKMPLDAVTGTSIYRFIAPENMITFNALLKQGVGKREINFQPGGGAPLPVYLSVSSLQSEGSPNAWCLVATDLTEQKKNEEIVAAERLARSIIEQAAEAIVVCDTEGRVTHFSTAVLRICECDPTFQRFEGIIDIRSSEGEDAGKSILPISSALKGSAMLGIEATLELKNCQSIHQKLHLLLNSGPLKNSDGKIIGCVVTLADITERKRAEKALRESEEKFRSSFANAAIGFSMSTPEGCILDANPAYCKIIGHSIEELRNKAFSNFIHPEDFAENMRLIERMFDGQINDFVLENRYLLKDGSVVWVRKSVSLVRNSEGMPQWIIALIEDITKRKEAEKALNYAAEQRRLALEIAQLGTWEYDLTNGLNWWDQRCGEIFGLGHDQAFTNEEIMAIVHPEDRQHVSSQISAALDPAGPGIYDTEYRIQRDDGTEHWVAVRGRSFFESMEQKPARFIGTLMDITEIKEAEIKLKETLDNLENLVKERTKELEKTYSSLKESERGLAEAQKMARLGNWDLNIVTRESYWSDEIYEIFGYKPQEFSPTYDAFLNHIHLEDRDYVDRAIKDALKGRASSGFEYRIISASGEERIVHAQKEVIFNEKNIPVRVRGIIQDITERKREERKINRYNNVLKGINRISGSVLRAETEEKLGDSCLSVALEVTDSQIGFVGEVRADGLLHDIAISDMGWKQCLMYDKTGHRRPPGDFILHGLYSSVIDTGKSLFTNNPASHPNSIGLPQGHPEITSFLGVPLILDRKTAGILAVANREGGYSYEQQADLEAIAPAITQALKRKKAEEALDKMDKIRIKEIHHRIKNNLQVICSLLSLESEKFNDEKILEAFRESQNRVASMALIHEELYRGDKNDSLDFAAYLHNLTADLFSSYSVGNDNVSLKMDLEQVHLDMDTAIPLGIIVNELVSNSLKHAFPAEREGEIRINLCKVENFAAKHNGSDPDLNFMKENGLCYVLMVTDDGKGIQEDIDVQNADSLGLQLVNILVEQIDGCIELRRDKGTKFIILFGNSEK